MRVLTVLEEGVRSAYLREAFRSLAGRGVDIRVVTLGRRGSMHEDLAALGVPANALGLDRRSMQALAPALLGRELRRQRPQLVHAHEALPAALVTVGARLVGSGAGLLYHRHHGVTVRPHASLSRFAARRADAVVAVSDFVARCAVDLDGVAADCVLMAHNGVPVPGAVSAATVADVRRSIGLPEDAVTVGVVARLRPEKGHRWLFAALPDVARGLGRPVHCLVVGHGPERAALEAARPADPMVEVHFVGPQADVGPWFAASDVVVVPSLHEPFGLVAIEAMALGRPLVASLEGGLAEIVEDGSTGILVPTGDDDRLAAALLCLLGDPAEASRLGAAGRSRYEDRFTTEHMVDAWWRTYLTATERAARRRSRRSS